MKQVLYWVIVFVFIFSVDNIYPQIGISYEIFVKNIKNRPVQNLDVWVIHGSTGEKILKQTGTAGKVSFNFTQGLWSLNLPGMLKYKEIIVKHGSRGRGSMSITYIPEVLKNEKQFSEQRAVTVFDTVDMTGTEKYIYKNGHFNLILKLQSPDKIPIKNTDVALVSPELSKIYTNRTDNAGEASFLVPLRKTYGIDIENIKNYSISDKLGDITLHRLTLTYEPAQIFQVVRNDSVYQKPTNDFKASNTHAFLRLTVLDISGTPLSNEPVYLNQIIGNTIYSGETNESGDVLFLLPKGDKYMINFQHQHDVDVVDLRTSKGLVTFEAQITYQPDQRLKYPEVFIPSPEELLLEEFENFITKQLPLPTDSAVGLYASWGNNKITKDSREAVLELGIAVTDEMEYKNVSPPANFAFVLDRSGSMAGDGRVEALKKSILDFLKDLREEDQVSIVSFHNFPYIEYKLAPIRNYNSIENTVESIEPLGGTNIYEGLISGYEQLMNKYDSAKTNHLILLTDGYGVTEPSKILDTSFYYINRGIGFSAIGVGDRYNYSLLSLLASKGGGLLQHSGKSDELYDDFNVKLKQMIYPVARNAKIEIEYNEDVEYNQLFGYDVTKQEENKVIINVGNLYAGQNKIAMAQFLLSNPDSTIENKPVSLKISYFDLLQNKEVNIEQNLPLDWNPYSGEKGLIIDNHLKRLYGIAIINQSLKAMTEAFKNEEIAEAYYLLERTSVQLKEIFPNSMDSDVERLAGKLAEYIKIVRNAANNKGIKL